MAALRETSARGRGGAGDVMLCSPKAWLTPGHCLSAPQSCRSWTPQSHILLCSPMFSQEHPRSRDPTAPDGCCSTPELGWELQVGDGSCQMWDEIKKEPKVSVCLCPLSPVAVDCSHGLWQQGQTSLQSEAPHLRQQLQPKSAGLSDLPWGRAHPAGPSGDVCPQRLFQAPPSRTRLGREQARRRTTTSMSTCCGCNGQCNALPSLAVLHQKPESLFFCSAPSPGSAFPRQDVAPDIAPNQQISANLLHTGAAWQCWTPGTSQRSCACPTELWLSLRASLLFWWRVLFHCCLPSSQGSKF